MKLNAIGVASSDLRKTVVFYSLLGFEFPEFAEDDKHLEPTTPDGSARLMIDTFDVIKDILGENPKPGTASAFALQYDSPDEVDAVTQAVAEAGFIVVKEPWDAFWGQRYAVVEDPDGYKVDLYASSKF